MAVGLLLVFFLNHETKVNINDAGWILFPVLFIREIGNDNKSSEKNCKNNPTGVTESKLVAHLVWSFIATLIFICCTIERIMVEGSVCTVCCNKTIQLEAM